ncbi:MAG: hypothetical protein HY736_15740 [Verrucomicrobia bacterium]|nr:hypothetical protein [Verrucomicrobiota bacterium]
MKNDHDPKLRQVLETWQVSPPPAPNFKSNVWRRIAAAEKRVGRMFGQRLREWLVFELPKPVHAAALLAITAVLGTTFASVRAERARDRYRIESARLYLASIDPMSMATRVASNLSR